MAVVSCKLMAKNASLQEDATYKHTYEHEFLVETNDATDGPNVIYNQMELVGPNPIPQLWDYYAVLTGTGSGDPSSYLQKREIRRLNNDEDDRKTWVVKCTWMPPEDIGEGGDPPATDPLLDPVRYHLEWASYTRLIDYDINGDPIVNSAGDRFDPPIERDDVRPVLVAVRNMYPLTSIINLALTYKNAINSDTFYGAPPLTAKVESITCGTIQERNGQLYYPVTIRVQFLGIGTGTADPNTNWNLRLVDRGRLHLRIDPDDPFETAIIKVPAKPLKYVAGDNTLIESYEENFAQSMDLVNLVPFPSATAGFRLLPDTEPAQFSGTAWQIYPDLPFSGLGI